MKITVKRLVSHNPSVPDIGTYKTTVTIRDGVLVSLTFPGELTRKKAIDSAYNALLNEPQNWGNPLIPGGFLWKLKRAK